MTVREKERKGEEAMIIELSNDYHGTIARLRVATTTADRIRVTARQARRAAAALCGVADCSCSGTGGTRGRQEWSLVQGWDEWHLERQDDATSG